MNPDIKAKLELCPRLPTLPGVALRIVQAARDPDVDLETVTELLSKDPALAAKILRVANSSLYKQFRGVQTLHQAVMVLGLNAAVTMTLSFSLATCLGDASQRGIDLDLFWRRALLSALAARLLGQHCDLASVEDVFLGALLQDIGMLALDAALPGEYASAIGACPDHDALTGREREQLATDHMEAGAWLMQTWRLPAYLATGIRASHDRERREMPAGLDVFAGCVAVSGRIADIYLADDKAAATATAEHVARTCLDLSADTLVHILTRLSESLSEFEALFERSLLSPAQAMGLTEQAREVLATRNLVLLQNAVADRSREAEFQELADRLYEAAHRDSLTGVFNRRHFDDALEKAFTEAGGQREPLSVAYIDLDEFKQINDRHGHVTGDRILTAIARHMQSRLRSNDVIARYGGEEFVVLMPGLGRAAAFEIIERIRTEVAELAHGLESGGTHYVTVSAGIASCGDGASGPHTSTELMRAADRALYRAKRRGRNLVLQAESAASSAALKKSPDE